MFKYIGISKQTLVLLSFCLTASVGFGQVPNGDFEAWETADSIENPVFWESNNYYVGYSPVSKTQDAIQGNYSMKVSSTAKDFSGLPIGDGCAHVKLVPNEVYQYLTASVKIDTVDTNGEVFIRVKQWQSPSTLFEKIGTWKTTVATNGVIQVVLPIAQTGLDTLLIEIWANNNYDLMSNPGYTEIIIDNIELKTTVATHEPVDKSFGVLFPNPTAEILHVKPLVSG